MYYEVAAGHGLPHDPFKALVAPRPIGWISSVDAKGRTNLAPYSFFNAVSSRPPVVMFSSEGWKDSVANIEETGSFVCNIVGEAMTELMNRTSASLPHGTSEFDHAGLTPVPGTAVAAPRVAEAPAALECVYLETLRLTGRDGRISPSHIVFGEVVAVHIADELLKDGLVDVAKLRPLSRLGYMDYALITGGFTMQRPQNA